MAVSKRRGKWAVTVYDPTTRGKRWVGTFDSHREAKDAEGDARKQVRRQQGRVLADEFAATWSAGQALLIEKAIAEALQEAPAG